MSKKKKYTFFKGCDFAWQGILWNTLYERNMRIHLMMTFFVVFFGVFFHISLTEWLVIFIFLALIPTLELINSAIESTCDVLRDELKLNYKATKLPRDLAAGAVLWASFFALLTGLIIFLPRFLYLLTTFLVSPACSCL